MTISNACLMYLVIFPVASAPLSLFFVRPFPIATPNVSLFTLALLAFVQGGLLVVCGSFCTDLVMCLSFRVLAILNVHVTMYLFCSAVHINMLMHLRGHGTLGESWVGVMRTVLSAEAPERQSTFPGTVTVRPRDVLVCIVCVRAVFTMNYFKEHLRNIFRKHVQELV